MKVLTTSKQPSSRDTLGGFNALQLFERYKLTFIAGPALIILLALTALSLWTLGTASVDKVRAFRGELFQRDLQDISSRMDPDERVTLSGNLVPLIGETRRIAPLLLPRQYYIGMPPGWSRLTPRTPPRNCFVRLKTSDGRGDPLRFCAYFSENASLGNWLFLAVAFEDLTVAPLRSGDVSMNADAIKLEISLGNLTRTWWVAVQSAREPQRNRYELVAFRQEGGFLARDKKVEGWAYVQPGRAAKPNAVNLVARLDFKELLPVQSAKGSDLQWPPVNWRDTNIKVSRRNASPNYLEPSTVEYPPFGRVELSLPSLAEPIFAAHGSLQITHSLEAQGPRLDISPPTAMQPVADARGSLLRLVDGDLLIRWRPLSIAVAVPDTVLTLQATHPGTVIQKEIWATGVLLALLFLGGLASTAYFFVALLKPIGVLAALAQRQISHGDDGAAGLPYQQKKNEIGSLARAFAELLKSTRIRAARDAREQEENLKIVGHEILSPLQALMNSVALDHPGRRFVDRMVSSVTALFGGGGPAAFSRRTMALEPVDLAQYLVAAAENAWGATVEDVVYVGPQKGVICTVDPDALEDALTNVLGNAKRYRAEGTEIVVTLVSEGRMARIFITNAGRSISEDVLPHVFEWKFSTDVAQGASNQGLGLAVARSYLVKMGGDITMHNVDVGVQVSIELPLTEKR